MGPTLLIFYAFVASSVGKNFGSGVNNNLNAMAPKHYLAMREMMRSALVQNNTHFESKNLIPSAHPESRNVCWEKCEKGEVNKKDELLKTVPDPKEPKSSTESQRNRKLKRRSSKLRFLNSTPDIFEKDSAAITINIRSNITFVGGTPLKDLILSIVRSVVKET